MRDREPQEGPSPEQTAKALGCVFGLVAGGLAIGSVVLVYENATGSPDGGFRPEPTTTTIRAGHPTTTLGEAQDPRPKLPCDFAGAEGAPNDTQKMQAGLGINTSGPMVVLEFTCPGVTSFSEAAGFTGYTTDQPAGTGPCVAVDVRPRQSGGYDTTMVCQEAG